VVIEIKKPELEALIEELQKSGASIDDLLFDGLKALESTPKRDTVALPSKPSKRLIEILMSPPFAGSGLKIERLRESPQPPLEL
jgi:hypothetical protein